MSESDIGRVERALDEVGEPDSVEEVTAADMERLRTALPTDPQTARIVNRALPFPWGEVFEYVSPSENQSGYWRTKPDRSQPRSEAEAATRQAFAESARQVEGVEGTIETPDGELPPAAVWVRDRLGDRRFSLSSASVAGRKALNRLRTVLGQD